MEDFELRNEENVQDKLDNESYISRLKFHSAHDLENYLKRTYAGKIGVEFEHVLSYEERAWLYDRFEELSSHKLNEAQKKNILGLVTDCEVKPNFHPINSRQLITFYIRNFKLLRDIQVKVLSLS